MAINAVALIGPTGSGKSTIANALRDYAGRPVISSGDIARKLAEADEFTKAGLARGDYAPELAIRQEVIHLVEASMVSHGAFIIDGFPRKLEQLVLFEQLSGIKPAYFVVNTPRITCIRRLVARGRKDDHPDAVAERLRHYQEHTVPMIDALQFHCSHLPGLEAAPYNANNIARTIGWYPKD